MSPPSAFRCRRREGGLFLLGILALCGFAACGRASQTPDAPPALIATLPPLADWCRVLLEADATVYTLLQPGQTPHGFEPTPEDARRITDARILIAWGGGVDDWAAKLVAAAHAGTPTVWLYQSSSEAAAHEHDTDENPHTWLDPEDARARLDRLATALIPMFPERAEDVRARATAYDAELIALRDRARRARLAWQGAGAVTLHDAWLHFFAACGVRSLGSIQAASGAPPSSRHIATLIEALKAHPRVAVVAEPQVSPTMARAVAREAGAPLLVLDPLGREDVPGYDRYLRMMHANLDTLADAFGPIPES